MGSSLARIRVTKGGSKRRDTTTTTTTKTKAVLILFSQKLVWKRGFSDKPPAPTPNPESIQRDRVQEFRTPEESNRWDPGNPSKPAKESRKHRRSGSVPAFDDFEHNPKTRSKRRSTSTKAQIFRADLCASSRRSKSRKSRSRSRRSSGFYSSRILDKIFPLTELQTKVQIPIPKIQKPE